MGPGGALRLAITSAQNRRGSLECMARFSPSAARCISFDDQHPEAQVPGAKVVVQFVDAAVGGRQRPAFLARGYRPHFRVGDGDYLGVAFSGDDSGEPVRPGICVSAEVEFLYIGGMDYSALDSGAQFVILEGARTVGVGVVIERLP